MGTQHAPADDIVYNLVSIQYHALKGAQLYEKFIGDPEGHDDVAQFVRQIQDEDARRALSRPAQDAHQGPRSSIRQRR